MTSDPRYTAERLGPYPDKSYWWAVRDRQHDLLVADQYENLLRWQTRDGADAWIDREQTLDGQR